jgi:PilZ domain
VKATSTTTAAGPHHVKRGATTRMLSAEERRRAQRVLLKMRILVRVPGKPNPIEGSTHTVSENGAMLVLKDTLPEGTKISIENPKSQKTVEARVVRPPQMGHEGALVPVEFTSPSPSFWNIFFPRVLN